MEKYQAVPAEPEDLTVIRFSLTEFAIRSDDQASTEEDPNCRWFLAGWPSANVVPGMTWRAMYLEYIQTREVIVYPGSNIYLFMYGKKVNADGSEY